MVYLIFILFISCSHVEQLDFISKNKPELKLKQYKPYSNQDYVDQLKSFDEIYLNNLTTTKVPLGKADNEYLYSLVKRITSANELFFQGKAIPEFNIIESKTPFHFSLPGHKFFISTGMLKKYVKNESMLYCLLVYELIRSEKNIFEKGIIIPTGAINTRRILSLLKIKTEDKVEVHKWSFYLLKRIGMESDSYLSWLQIKNRNSLDFALQLGDVRSISREEALFKAFLIDNYLDKKSASKYRGSSKRFYKFIRSI